jgi:hypothetical protein
MFSSSRLADRNLQRADAVDAAFHLVAGDSAATPAGVPVMMMSPGSPLRMV